MKTLTCILFMFCLTGLRAQSLSPSTTPLTAQAKSNAMAILSKATNRVVALPKTTTLAYDLALPATNNGFVLIQFSTNFSSWCDVFRTNDIAGHYTWQDTNVKRSMGFYRIFTVNSIFTITNFTTN